MGNKIFVFILLCIVDVWEVNLMALEGPPLTKYDPCGLGIIHFDRISWNYWLGVINFNIYPNINEAEILVSFEKETTVLAYTNIQNVTITKQNNHTVIVHTIRQIPEKYEFYITLNNLNPNVSDVPIVSLITVNKVTLCDEKLKASQTIKSLNVTNKFSGKLVKSAHLCGRRALSNEELVSVRTESRPGDWPWHVAIFVRDKNNVPRYHCGGNIVSSTAIVTAGHCVFKDGMKLTANQVLIVAGSSNHTDLDHIGRQSLNAVEIVLHPAYIFEYPTSDLAIIRVNRLMFTEYVQPICIWGPVYDKTDLFGKEATIVGFGSTEYNKQSNILRSANTVVQQDDVCITFSPQLYPKLLNEFTFCAGYGPDSGINPRNGDSGGGLVLPKIQHDHKISWFLRGVLSKCGVSPGNTECDPRYYVVYVNVAPHYGWIYHHAGLEFRSNVLTI